MNHITRRAFIPLCGLFLLPSLSAATAQPYPSKPVTLIIAHETGGSADIVGRMVADKLKDRLGQPVVVENRPAGSGIGAYNAVARAKPADGYTLAITSNQFSVGALLSKSAEFDPVKDFTHIIELGQSVYSLVTTPSQPFKTLSELAAYAKQHPGQVTVGVGGMGTALEFTSLWKTLGVDVKIVPYNGTGPMMNAVLGGHLQVGIAGIVGTQPHIAAGTMTALAVSSPARFPLFPDIPALGELVPGYAGVPVWYGVCAPAGLPDDIAARLNKEINEILAEPALAAQLKKFGAVVTGGSVAKGAAAAKSYVDVNVAAAKAINWVPQ